MADQTTQTTCFCHACDPKHGEIGLECKKPETTPAPIKYLPLPLQMGKYTLSGPYMFHNGEKFWVDYDGEGMTLSFDDLEKFFDKLWEGF